MPELTSSALAATAAGASGLAVVATTMGVPAPIVLAGVLGATIAVAQSGKVAWGWSSVMAALLSFGASLGIGIWGGNLIGRLVVNAINAVITDPHLQLPASAADPLCTLVLSMVGQRELLPLAIRALAGLVGPKGGIQ